MDERFAVFTALQKFTQRISPHIIMCIVMSGNFSKTAKVSMRNLSGKLLLQKFAH